MGKSTLKIDRYCPLVTVVSGDYGKPWFRGPFSGSCLWFLGTKREIFQHPFRRLKLHHLSWCRWPSCINNWWRKACHRYLAPLSHSDVGGSHYVICMGYSIICLHSDGSRVFGNVPYRSMVDGIWCMIFFFVKSICPETRWIAVRFFKLTVYPVFCALQKTNRRVLQHVHDFFSPLASYQTCVVLFFNFVETLCYGEVSLPSGMHWMLGGSVKSQT